LITKKRKKEKKKKEKERKYEGAIRRSGGRAPSARRGMDLLGSE
jgi:hypothetical protein